MSCQTSLSKIPKTGRRNLLIFQVISSCARQSLVLEKQHNVCIASAHSWYRNIILITTSPCRRRGCSWHKSSARCWHHIRKSAAEPSLLIRRCESAHTPNMFQSIRQTESTSLFGRQSFRSVHGEPTRGKRTERLRNGGWTRRSK